MAEGEDVETHLDLLLRTAEGQSLEEVFLEAKKTFLTEKLSRIQEEIDGRGIPQDQGFLLMVLYLFQFVEREGGSAYREPLLEAFAFTGWPLPRFRPLLEREGLKARAGFLVDLHYESPGPEIRELLVGQLLEAWNLLGLGRDPETENRDLLREKARLYSLIGSPPDRERWALVRRLSEVGGPRLPLALRNIGIVPTEACPSDCRFCLAPWRATVEERRGRALEEGEFQSFADQVIALAERRGLVLTITGGEPFLEMGRVAYILERARSPVELTTSGFWAQTSKKAERRLAQLMRVVGKNRHPRFRFSLQISLDSFHQEPRLVRGKLIENVPLTFVANAVEASQRRFPQLELCLLTKFTRYRDPLPRLLREFEKRGIQWRLREKGYDPDLKVTVPGKEGELVPRPLLLKAYLQLSSPRIPRGARPIFLLYTAVEGIGRAAGMEPFEFPSFTQRTREFLTREQTERLPVIGMEVSDDGTVYPGAHALYSWSIGSLQEETLEEIVLRSEHDPLFLAMAENPGRIRDLGLEADPGLRARLERASSPLVALYEILSLPSRRLYITRRLLMEDPRLPEGLRRELGLLTSKAVLLEEYRRQREEEEKGTEKGRNRGGKER
jgi:hypothetical protein